jgi:hypothetical protein
MAKRPPPPSEPTDEEQNSMNQALQQDDIYPEPPVQTTFGPLRDVEIPPDTPTTPAPPDSAGPVDLVGQGQGGEFGGPYSPHLTSQSPGVDPGVDRGVSVGNERVDNSAPISGFGDSESPGDLHGRFPGASLEDVAPSSLQSPEDADGSGMPPLPGEPTDGPSANARTNQSLYEDVYGVAGSDPAGGNGHGRDVGINRPSPAPPPDSEQPATGRLHSWPLPC